MADVSLVKGGTPRIRYMWCERDYPQFSAPFGNANIERTPPYDAHLDGAYGSGLAYFTMGMPVRPNLVGMEWQRKALADKSPDVDDIIDLLVIPENHFVTDLNFKIMQSDSNMAGATIALTARELVFDPSTGDYTFTEISDIEDAFSAQGLTTPIPIDEPYNAYVSLRKVDSGYVMPLYANPGIPPATGSDYGTTGRTLILGAKVVSVPTDANYGFQHMLNGWYLSVKVQGFECPTYM